MTAAVLYPNFGAEENDAPPSPAPPPQVQRLLGLWQRLFEPGGAFAHVHGLVPWLSTPRAAGEAKRLGLPLWGPDPDVVTAVHDKAFVAREDPFCVVFAPGTLSEPLLKDALRRLPSWAQARWTLKPRYSTSGRGRYGSDSPGLAGALRRLNKHGAILEPWFLRTSDLSAVFLVDDDIHLLGTTRQTVSPSGAYHGCVVRLGPGDRVRADDPFEDELEEEATAVVRRAAREGFRGPCGVDAFVWAEPKQKPQLRICEFNARFTAGVVAVCLARQGAAEGVHRARLALDEDPPFRLF